MSQRRSPPGPVPGHSTAGNRIHPGRSAPEPLNRHAQSGFPMTPVVGINQSGDGDTRIPDVPILNPNFEGNVILGADGFKKTGRYFDPNAFLLPATGTFGNVARGRFTGPGFYNVDTS